MQLHVVQTLVDVIHDLDELLACRRESWILQSLREMFGLREVL